MKKISSFVRCSLVLVFQILLFIQFSNSQPSAPHLKNKCTKRGLECVPFPDCPDACKLILQKKVFTCGYEKKILKICCDPKNPTATTNTTLSPSEAPFDVYSKSTPPQKTPSNSTNAAAIALDYCKKFERYTIVHRWLDPQLPGRKGIWYDIKDCVLIDDLMWRAISDPKEYPHMALIGYGNNFTNVAWNCGGSLISEKFILSAAHCGTTSPSHGPPQWALLGDLDISTERDDAKPAVYTIVNVYNHPDYEPSSRYNDISLFELETTVAMGPYVRPACLHTSINDLQRITTVAEINGWGRTRPADRTSNKLRKTRMSLFSDEKCRKSFNATYNSTFPRGYDTNTMICAEPLNNGFQDITECWGDSGGPLQTTTGDHVCMWNIIGVMSMGPGICENKTHPGIYTKVAFYLDWIQGIVWPQ